LKANERSPLAVPLFPSATDWLPLAVVARLAAKEFSPLARVFSPKAAEPYPRFARSQ
jgi:hypothetical protein